jgi:hypothetical protein
MGHVSIVYGIIIGAPSKIPDYHKLQHLNNKVLASLPENDNFPWVTKNMFHFQDPENIEGTYREQIIAFAASYKEIEYEWEVWLEKFESVLKQLYWISAKIHLETDFRGSYVYEWVFDINQTDNWTSDNPTPTSIWTFEGGPRKII